MSTTDRPKRRMNAPFKNKPLVSSPPGGTLIMNRAKTASHTNNPPKTPDVVDLNTPPAEEFHLLATQPLPKLPKKDVTDIFACDDEFEAMIPPKGRDTAVQMMGRLSRSCCAEVNGVEKKLAPTAMKGSYADLSAAMKDKVKTFWTLLEQPVQRHIKNNCEVITAEEVISSQNSITVPLVLHQRYKSLKRKQCMTSMEDDDGMKPRLTTKNDAIRLLHLRKCPEAKIHWDRAYNPHPNRATLDAVHSKSTDREDNDELHPFNALAKMFNNRNNTASYNPFQPENEAFIGPENAEDVWDPAKLVPRPGCSPEIVAEFHRLNPADQDQNVNERDGAWIKTTWGHLRTRLSVVWKNFNASGQHKGDVGSLAGRTEWIFKFADREEVAVKYAVLLLKDMDLKDLGREVELEVGGRESSIKDYHNDGGYVSAVSASSVMTDDDTKRHGGGGSSSSSGVKGIRKEEVGPRQLQRYKAAEQKKKEKEKEEAKQLQLEQLKLIMTKDDELSRKIRVHLAESILPGFKAAEPIIPAVQAAESSSDDDSEN